jgi:hypothetical protein
LRPPTPTTAMGPRGISRSVHDLRCHRQTPDKSG